MVHSSWASYAEKGIAGFFGQDVTIWSGGWFIEVLNKTVALGEKFLIWNFLEAKLFRLRTARGLGSRHPLSLTVWRTRPTICSSQFISSTNYKDPDRNPRSFRAHTSLNRGLRLPNQSCHMAVFANFSDVFQVPSFYRRCKHKLCMHPEYRHAFFSFLIEYKTRSKIFQEVRKAIIRLVDARVYDKERHHGIKQVADL